MIRPQQAATGIRASKLVTSMPSIKELRSAVDKRNDGDEQQQVIQGFRNEERTTEMKDQLTTIFVSPDVDKAEKAAKYTGLVQLNDIENHQF